MTHGEPEPTLRELSEQIDRERFVGRDAELALIDGARRGEVPTRVFFLHGPGGVGKSALLREAARRAEHDGLAVVRIDGRTVTCTGEGLAEALVGASGRSCLLIIDEADHLESLHVELASRLADTLSARSVALVAGRIPPAKGWGDAALAHVWTDRRLRPLPAVEARELLRRGGIEDEAEAEALIGWSGGFPLPLVVAIESQTSAVGSVLSPASSPPDVAAAVLERLAGHELDGIDPDVVDVAAVAPAVDGALMAAVLPGRSTRVGLQRLRASSVTELVGGRSMLHPLVRTAARARLRDTDPDRYRSLVLAIAEHIHERVITDGSWRPIDISDLVDEPTVRQRFGPSSTHFSDRPRPHDHAVLAERMGGRGRQWWDRFERWCDEAPHAVIVCRRSDGVGVGIAVAAPARALPPWAYDQPDQGPALRHAEAAGRIDSTVFVHELKVVEESESAHAEAIRVGNLGLAQLLGAGNPRWVYVTVPEDSVHGLLPFGYQPIPELARHDGERALVTVLMDHGNGGLAGTMRDLIRFEQGAGTSAGDDRRLHLVEALRAFRDHDSLARSPLAVGEGSSAVDGVRRQVHEAIEATFGPSDEDRSLALALRRAYIDSDGGHATARAELHMSRAAFYRHLQRGRDRLAREPG